MLCFAQLTNDAPFVQEILPESLSFVLGRPPAAVMFESEIVWQSAVSNDEV